MLAAEWSEVLPSEVVRQRGEQLARSPCAACSRDAFQLGAALVWSWGETHLHTLVSFDERLREAAQREGFLIAPE
ncbi:MAG: hypothetical protein U0610_20870 [bacterium]